MSRTITQHDTLSPLPILDAAENYQGSIFDADEGRVYDAASLARARRELTAELARQGLEHGDRVLLAVPNGPAFAVALTSVLACDASPLLVHAKTPPAELVRYAQRFGTRYLLAQTSEMEPLASILQQPVTLGFPSSVPIVWGVIEGHGPPRGPDLAGVPLHPTSGSTGQPKIALRPAFAALEEARHYAATMALDADDLILAIPPMSHAYGYGTCVMVPLLTGASVVTTSRFSVKKLQSLMSEHPITVLPNVPANIDLLLFGGEVDYGRLRWMLAAGAMLPGRSAEAFRQKTGVTVCPLYGTTETGGISVATAADGRDVDGRVGPPMEGVEVRVARTDEDQSIEADVGRLWVRSSSMMHGYLDDEGRITSPLVDGWFETGDLARLAADGGIHLRGRTGEVINVLGLKVVPCEVEEAIAQLPGVREVKVYASRRSNRAEIVKAAVAVEPGVTEGDIRAHCEQHLVYYKRPQSIVLVDRLPRSPAGKIIRDQLP